MNALDIIVLAAVAVWLALSVAYAVRVKKRGGSCCGGGCERYGSCGSCPYGGSCGKKK